MRYLTMGTKLAKIYFVICITSPSGRFLLRKVHSKIPNLFCDLDKKRHQIIPRILPPGKGLGEKNYDKRTAPLSQQNFITLERVRFYSHAGNEQGREEGGRRGNLSHGLRVYGAS